MTVDSNVVSHAIDDAAVDIAERAEFSPDVAPEAIRDFVTACGWKHDGGAWWHPVAGMRSRRLEALAWCVADERRRFGHWPAFCESCWRL
jgi:hypothetical protein